MPELDFKGKEFVRNHHLTVPYRPLVPDKKKSVGDGGLDGNLIIHGDNLHALKALMPRYAGKVDCIFIDPPYNTGNEKWSYNDNVNSPLMREWLKGNPINAEDMLRHDKWCCMMWPRLKLLWELLSDDGSLWMTLDDNEAHRATAIMQEIGGEMCCEVAIAWEKRYTRSNNAQRFSSSKDNLLVFGKEGFEPGKEARSDESAESYTNPDDDPNGPWITASYVNPATREQRPNLCYAIHNPITGKDIKHPTHAWKYKLATHMKHVQGKRLYWGEQGEHQYPRLKIYLKEGVVPIDVWSHYFAGTTDLATAEIQSIFGSKVFETPKPTLLVSRILELALPEQKNSVVLDSFAGSGTTAHAVMNANLQDGGSRRYVLVEMEDYANTVTAERVRRVIKGYPFEGTQREVLLERNLTWTEVKKADALVKEVESIREVRKASFDKVKAEVKDGKLRVIGERKVKEKAPGLGGSFTFCTLGDPVDTDRILEGATLPTRAQMAEWLLYTAFGKTDSDGSSLKPTGELKKIYVGKMGGTHVWLIYEPDIEFLQGPKVALTRELAQRIDATDRHSNHLVFSAAKYVGHKALRDDTKGRVEHALIPFSLFKLERD